MNLTPGEIVATLSKISKEIDEQANIVADIDMEATEKRVTYKREYYKAFLVAQGAIDLKKVTAEHQTIDLFRDAEYSESSLRAAREKLKVLRDRLEVGRSLGASMRMEWSNGRD